jgi:hypothetical protein
MSGRNHGPLAECWCCGRPGRHAGRGLCERCYNRWHQHGFAGPGPGPEFIPQAERAREYAHVITTLSARAAGEKLGISARTVQRWRAALREAVPC